MSPVKPLVADELRWKCDPKSLEISDKRAARSFDKIIGQRRAVEAVRLGLEMDQPGYNIFVAGMSGTGRKTTIRRLLRDVQDLKFVPDDLCYVNNFRSPDQPMAVSLPAGKGKKLKADVDRLVENLTAGIPAVFDSEQYQEERKRVANVFNERRQAVIKEFEEKLQGRDFAMIQVQMGPFMKPDILPKIDGKPVPIEELESLVQQEKFEAAKLEEIKTTREEMAEEMVKAFKETKQIEQELQEALDKLDKGIITPIIHEQVAAIDAKYDNKKVSAYLRGMEEHIVTNLDRFRSQESEKEPGGFRDPTAVIDPFLEFRVNVMVDNSETEGRPVIIETSPTYRNLFGTIERIIDRSGAWRTDFTKIKAGSFLRANGGFLVINAYDALVEAGVWEALKRTLRNGKVEILTYDPFFNMFTGTLKPESIEINVKVVMIGESFIYYLLREQDVDFPKIFKVKAEFDTEMPRDEENIQEYVSFVRMVCRENKLSRFAKSGISALVEFGVRLAGWQNKLSTRFSVIADVMREADYWAKKAGAKTVVDKHVEKAVEAYNFRMGLVEDRIQERIEEGVLYIDTKGSAMGQINGLSVYNLGEYMFGIPSRITAQTSLGRAGVINIEREAAMSGPTHNKGVLILSGYLQGKFAQNKPLAMNASICFEQSYGGVDGDSASSTEIYAILSSLAEVPIRQDLAVTGSVNQWGKIQPIGGVNAKIEGFFRACKERGLTENQGVVIPKSNQRDLMLKSEVIEAVKDKKFHIYAVDTVEEGVELLMGMSAGERDAKGEYPEDTVFGKADRKLQHYAELIRDYGPGGDGRG
jgi:lon-related putative ATP-dependent protease